MNFIEQCIENDIKNGLSRKKIRFRFPPEPNGYLHIGHLKAICINFELGNKYNAPVNLRFDDTNPVKEEKKFIDSIKEDIKWLGFNWDKESYASDYFDQLYIWAIELIKSGKAYIDDQSSEEIISQRKTPFENGINSPYRNRTIEENLFLFKEMKYGKRNCVLRAKINMNSTNMNMRDPIMYRTIYLDHHRTYNKWKIYPTYDWAHGQCDYIEGISHSICSLEFENHRPLYEWYLKQIYSISNIKSKQIEFSRLNITYSLTSKRKLEVLLQNKIVNDWDDPRMVTIAGLRRRGYTAESLKKFINCIGVTKRENLIDIDLLEFFVRKHLNKVALRMMAVIEPIKLIIINYPKNKIEFIETENNPEMKNLGTRKIPLTRELYIEKNDFMENCQDNFFRLSIGNEVRLKSAYIIKGESVIKNKDGKITTIFVSYDPKSKSGNQNQFSNKKIKSTLHWVSAKSNIPIEIRIYDKLFNHKNPEHDKKKHFMEFVNKDSLKIMKGFGEINLTNVNIDNPIQFQRLGYFIKDRDSTKNILIFNKTVSLRTKFKINH